MVLKARDSNEYVNCIHVVEFEVFSIKDYQYEYPLRIIES